MRCRQCGAVIKRNDGLEDVRRHIDETCGPAFTRRFLACGFRPFPETTSLPLNELPYTRAITCAPYEGEPREQRALLVRAEPQVWLPLWVDVVVSCWSDHIGRANTAHEEARRIKQRNTVLTHVLLPAPSLQRTLEATWHAAGYAGAIPYLRVIAPDGWLPRIT